MNTPVQITPISNGYLVGTQGEQPTQSRPQGTPPSITYCATYEDVCNTIKPLFPPAAIPTAN